MVSAETIQPLLNGDDISWGEYYLRNDPSAGSLESGMRQRLIREALDCASDKVNSLISKYGKRTVAGYASLMGVRIVRQEIPADSVYLPLAQYSSDPPVISVSYNILEILNGIIERKSLPVVSGVQFLGDLAAAHELFHHLETLDAGIFTRKKSAERKLLRFFSCRFCPIGLSELAAVKFSGLLLGLGYCPGVYEAVLTGRFPFAV